jgi:hypothetical protein
MVSRAGADLSHFNDLGAKLGWPGLRLGGYGPTIAYLKSSTNTGPDRRHTRDGAKSFCQNEKPLRLAHHSADW